MHDPCFIPFSPADLKNIDLPDKLNTPFELASHPLMALAIQKLQNHLQNQSGFEHNFGLGQHSDLKTIGKMMGVLIVKNKKEEIGFLQAFSGKMADTNTLDGFVNPVYDMLQEGGFINKGMNDLKQMSSEIEETKKKGLDCLFLHKKRKALSHRLQSELFDNYNFVNQYGAEKNVRELFPQTPPSAAGECSAPKLLQHTFLKGYTPLFISEFWWGASPKSTKWQHKEFYPACEEKCRPILSYMLKGIQMA